MHNMVQLLLILLWVFCTSGMSQDVSFLEDIKALSELPLDKLLNLKKSFDNNEDNFSQLTSINSTLEGSKALPLQSKKGQKEREVYLYEESPSNDKSTNIQSIFQISITTLAFLAFGGYLICLLVQAVKGKTNNYQATTTQIMSALLSSQIKKKRPTRIPHRRKPTSSNGYRRRPRPKREILNGLDVENMYHYLINMSEGYTKYHTEDYSRYNFSSNYF